MRTKPPVMIPILAIALGVVASFGHVAAKPGTRDFDTFTVDVAVDHETFAVVPSTGLVLTPESLGPNRGTTFIVNGTVFRGGTLQEGNGMGDPNQGGGIAAWICKGIFTSDLATEDIGFNTTQMFQFSGDDDAIWTEGLEAGLGKAGVVTHRTILGGTGRFRGAQGEVIQTALGTNITGTPNIRVKFKVLRDR